MNTTETTTTMGFNVETLFTPKEITNGIDTETINKIRASFIDFGTFLQTTLTEGRYKALLFTKLEEAAMFATKAITHGTTTNVK